MKGSKDEFKKAFIGKINDLSEVIFQGFKTGVYDNRNKATFTEENVTGSIKISTDLSPINKTVEHSKFLLVFKEKVTILKEQVFYALDKGIIDNKTYLRFSEGGIYCSITLKTSGQSEEEKTIKDFLRDLVSEQDNKLESEDSKRMIT